MTFSNTKQFQVCNLTPNSNHCTIMVTLDSKLPPQEPSQPSMSSISRIKFVIKSDHIEHFRYKLEEKIEKVMHDIYMDMTTNIPNL